MSSSNLCPFVSASFTSLLLIKFFHCILTPTKYHLFTNEFLQEKGIKYSLKGLGTSLLETRREFVPNFSERHSMYIPINYIKGPRNCFQKIVEFQFHEKMTLLFWYLILPLWMKIFCRPKNILHKKIELFSIFNHVLSFKSRWNVE